MNNKAITLSVAFAIFAVFMVHSYVSSIEEETKKKFGTELLVLIAKRDIKEMETINETMLELKAIPKLFLEPAAISFQMSEKDSRAVRDLKGLSGTVAIVPIKKDEQVTYNKVTEPNLRTGLAPQVTPGKRAVAVPVNEVTSVGKLVKPGDRIDIISVFDGGSGKTSRVAKTILQDVVVLAVGRNVTNNVPRIFEKESVGEGYRMTSLTKYDAFSSVTVEVDPMQAQALALVMSISDQSSLFLSLRNNDDQDRTNVTAIGVYDVLGADATRIRTPASGDAGVRSRR
jgi:pilus assembly protein CpaB